MFRGRFTQKYSGLDIGGRETYDYTSLTWERMELGTSLGTSSSLKMEIWTEPETQF